MGSMKLLRNVIAICLSISIAMPLLVSAYGQVSFTTVKATEKTYREFIRQLRERLFIGATKYDIPLLRKPSEVSVTDRYILVNLTNSIGMTITLGIDATTADIVGHQFGNMSYFFGNTAPHNIFQGTERTLFHFSGSYEDLAQVFGVGSREDAHLAMSELDLSVQKLANILPPEIADYSDVGIAYLTIIPMVSEAARFKYIEYKTQEMIRRPKNFPLHNTVVISFEDNWFNLSKAIQESNQGVFGCNIEMPKTDNSSFKVSSVTSFLVSNIVFMPFVSNNNCTKPEPTVAIGGRDGLCMDVKDAKYKNGNPVIIWKCKNAYDTENQQWSVRTDGTIRSKGMCLTSSGCNPGSNIVIHDCNTAYPRATIWQILPEKMILNTLCNLPLSAKSGVQGTVLTLDNNNGGLGQGGQGGFDVSLVTSVARFNGSCIRPNIVKEKGSLFLETCDKNKEEQLWASYPDGSIRPQQNQKLCMSIDEKNGRDVFIGSCSIGLASQRWWIRNNGAIVSPYKQLAIDADSTPPGMGKIIVSPQNGHPSQEWLLLL